MTGSSPGAIERIEQTLRHSALTAPGAQALVTLRESLDYATLQACSDGFAARLQARGVEPGDRIGVYLDKTPECVIGIYGAWAAGGIVVPINEGLRDAQVKHVLRDAGCCVLVSTPRKLSALEADTCSGVEVLEVCRETIGPVTGPVGNGPADPAAILYTSGSSGPPKGILLSHENLLAGTRIVARYLGLRASDRVLSVLPFSFDYGLNQLLTAMACGATLVLQRSSLPADVCRALDAQRITVLAGVPPFWNQLAQPHSPFVEGSFPALRIITNSGGTFPAELVAWYRELLPHTRIFLMYGLSEAFRSSYLPPEELDTHPMSMGKAIPETTLYVVDGEGRECQPGVPGELVHDGPTVALGYWRNDEASRRVFRPHPFEPESGRTVVYSGDLVKRDEDGYLYFVARRDQMIKSLGYRVSPEDLENQLRASRMLAEVVVGGVADPLMGQAIVAHVVPAHPQTFDLGELQKYCRRELPAYMIPRRIEVHTELPRTSSGKLDRTGILAC